MEKKLLNKQLSSLQDRILILKNYVMALHKWIIFSKVLIANKTEIEKNEIEIQTYETITKIAVAQKLIKQSEIIFENQLNEFVIDLAEMNEHYESYLEIAKKNQILYTHKKAEKLENNTKIIEKKSDSVKKSDSGNKNLLLKFCRVNPVFPGVVDVPVVGAHKVSTRAGNPV